MRVAPDSQKTAFIYVRPFALGSKLLVRSSAYKQVARRVGGALVKVTDPFETDSDGKTSVSVSQCSSTIAAKYGIDK